MAMFPSTVQTANPPGIAGDFADAGYFATATAHPGRWVGTSGIIPGNFVWGNYEDGVALGSGTSGQQPIGILRRSFVGVGFDPTVSSGAVAMQGAREVAPITHGCMWMTTTADVSVKNGVFKAFARLSDGALVPGAVGATVAGAVETPWEIHTSGLAGEIVKVVRR